MSVFVWLDYSERERRKMLDVVDLFREHDTRDELGVGSVRDAFADMLFPGTSTIMTRARYFLLVPWTYQKLERSRVKSGEIAARARRAELDLVEPIERSDDSDGNIGKVAKNTLKRLPSSVYWQGLSVWGIRSFRGAQVQYHRSLDRYYAQLTRHGGRAAERDVEKDGVAKYRRAFAGWAQKLSKRARALAEWQRERFWELVRSVNPRITGPTQDFVNTWWNLALAGDAARLCDSSTARLLIRERERRLKRNLARIDNPRAQELWTGDSGTAQLEFRWNISRRLLADIFEGLEKPDA